MLTQLDPNFEKSWYEHIEKIISLTAGVISELANQGWFVPSLGELRSRDTKNIRGLSNKSQTDRDMFLCEFYEARLLHIQSVLVRKYPVREQPLSQAFEAHENEKYFLSTNTFLSQADGIFQDLIFIENGVYSRKQNKGVPVVKQFLGGAKLDDYMLAYLQPLWSKNALNRNKRDCQDYPFMINRHSVLHGTSTNYGTKMNSLKSISFLFFVGTSIPEILTEIKNNSLNTTII
jgi:hypothetical protein